MANTLIELEELAESDEPDLDEEQDMATFEHGMLCQRFSRHIGNYIEGKNLGEVVDSSPEYRYLAKKVSDKAKKQPKRYPDVSFVRQERLPKRLNSYPKIAPDLAIEIVSPTDRALDIETKVKEYQDAGVSLVWVVHPFSRVIDIYCLANGLLYEPVGMSGELSGEAVIPGFKLPLATLFNYPAQIIIEEDED